MVGAPVFSLANRVQEPEILRRHFLTLNVQLMAANESGDNSRMQRVVNEIHKSIRNGPDGMNANIEVRGRVAAKCGLVETLVPFLDPATSGGLAEADAARAITDMCKGLSDFCVFVVFALTVNNEICVDSGAHFRDCLPARGNTAFLGAAGGAEREFNCGIIGPRRSGREHRSRQRWTRVHGAGTWVNLMAGGSD